MKRYSDFGTRVFIQNDLRSHEILFYKDKIGDFYGFEEDFRCPFEIRFDGENPPLLSEPFRPCILYSEKDIGLKEVAEEREKRGMENERRLLSDKVTASRDGMEILSQFIKGEGVKSRGGLEYVISRIYEFFETLDNGFFEGRSISEVVTNTRVFYSGLQSALDDFCFYTDGFVFDSKKRKVRVPDIKSIYYNGVEFLSNSYWLKEFGVAKRFSRGKIAENYVNGKLIIEKNKNIYNNR